MTTKAFILASLVLGFASSIDTVMADDGLTNRSFVFSDNWTATFGAGGQYASVSPTGSRNVGQWWLSGNQLCRKVPGLEWCGTVTYHEGMPVAFTNQSGRTLTMIPAQ